MEILFAREANILFAFVSQSKISLSSQHVMLKTRSICRILKVPYACGRNAKRISLRKEECLGGDIVAKSILSISQLQLPVQYNCSFEGLVNVRRCCCVCRSTPCTICTNVGAAEERKSDGIGREKGNRLQLNVYRISGSENDDENFK